MTFAAPLFLLAAAAGLIPVVLHLIHRQKAREVRFSTLRFLKLSVQRTLRRKYVEDMTLLLVRAGVLLLIAVGLARPALTSLASLWGGGKSAAVAIVLDNSASMALADAGRPRFETARQGVEQVLARLRPGDRVALLPTCGPPGPELGRLFRTHETVRQALELCRPAYERADLAVKLRQAEALLSQAEATIKEVYVFTENQAISWEGLKEPAHDESEEKGERGRVTEPPLVLVNVARDPAANVALQTIALDSPAPVAGAPFRASVEVMNTSTVPQQRHLELHIDGTRESISPTLSLPPGGTVKHELRFVLDRAGAHRGEVWLAEDDGSALDNRLSFAATVDQHVPVIVVKPRRDEVPQADDAYYLDRALASGGSLGRGFRVTTLGPESLLAEDLSAAGVIYCVNLPAPSPPAAEKLLAYVRSGGHVVWVCGQNVRPVAYNAMNALAQGLLLPAPLEELRRPLPGGVDGWHIGSLDKDDPALAPLTEPASLYQSVLVYKHFPISWGTQAAGRVLARLDDGQPLLVERAVGTGSVLLLGTGVHVDWSNLPLKPLFLPLVTRLTFRLAGAEAERTIVLAGARVNVPLGKEAGPAKEAEVEVVRPSGEVLRVRADEQEGNIFQYADTHEAGVYLVRRVDPQVHAQHAFAVNIDPAESDPTTLSRQELLARLGGRPLLYSESTDDLADMITRLREGTSLWELFLAAVLLGLVLEVFLANREAGAGEADARTSLRTTLTTPQVASAPESAEGSPAMTSDDVHDFLRHLERDTSRAP
jgi:hypothetical protein